LEVAETSTTKAAYKYAKKKIAKIEGKVLVCLALLAMATGCNTVGGLGRDVQWTAGKVADMAEQGTLEK